MQGVKFLNGKYMAKSVKEYIEENEARFLEEWFSLIRIPSVSADPARKTDMVACAERWKHLLLEAGADEARVMPLPEILWCMRKSVWALMRLRF